MLNHSLQAPAGKSVPNLNLSTEYAHVYDTVNVYFPEVIAGIAFTIIVTEDELFVVNDTKDPAYNTALLEQHLINFITEIAA